MNRENLVTTENLTKNYQQGDIVVHALDNVTLNIASGEFTTIVGPSGSGKTTLLNMIGGLDNPSSGNVSLANIPISTMAGKQLADFRRDHIGFVFQSYNLIPVLTAKENIEYVMILQGVSSEERHERVEAILNDVGLKGLGQRFPHQLSGGQQQRVAIARAMVAHPKLILADEPTANVDSHTAEDLLNIMHKLNINQGMTFLFSTHDPLVMHLARRVIHLKDGRIDVDNHYEEV